MALAPLFNASAVLRTTKVVLVLRFLQPAAPTVGFTPPATDPALSSSADDIDSEDPVETTRDNGGICAGQKLSLAHPKE